MKNDRIDSKWRLIAETLLRATTTRPGWRRTTCRPLSGSRATTRAQAGAGNGEDQALYVLDAYFPEYAALFSDAFGAASLRVLAECPTPAEVGRRRASTIARLLSDGSRGRLGDGKAAQIKAAAKSSVGIRLGERAASFQIKTMVTQVEVPQRHHSEGRGRGGGAAREGRAEHHHHPRRVHRDRADRRRDRRRREVQRTRRRSWVRELNSGVSESGRSPPKACP